MDPEKENGAPDQKDAANNHAGNATEINTDACAVGGVVNSKENAKGSNKDAGQNLDDARAVVDKRYYKRMQEAPKPMRKEAYHGLLGQAVNIAEPETEACPEALLTQLVISIGNMIGRSPFFNQGSFHHTSDYMVLCGATGVGRKGVSMSVVKSLLREIDSSWVDDCIKGGLQTGEALIDAIRDDVEFTDAKGEYRCIEGVEDKRLLILEEEFARLLGVGLRKGNPLSAVIREAFDCPMVLSAKSKTSPSRATNPHVSMIAHVTPVELLHLLNKVEVGNGFVNRIMFIESRPVERKPFAKIPSWSEHKDLIKDLQEAIRQAKKVHRMTWTDDGAKAWVEWYTKHNRPGGSIGNVLARAEAHLVRLSMIYALMDYSDKVSAEHFRAALAVWDYATQSARRIFGNSTGNKCSDKILNHLQRNGTMSRTDIHNALHRHVDSADLEEALHVLAANDLAEITVVEVESGKFAEIVTPKLGN